MTPKDEVLIQVATPALQIICVFCMQIYFHFCDLNRTFILIRRCDAIRLRRISPVSSVCDQAVDRFVL